MVRLRPCSRGAGDACERRLAIWGEVVFRTASLGLLEGSSPSRVGAIPVSVISPAVVLAPGAVLWVTTVPGCPVLLANARCGPAVI